MQNTPIIKNEEYIDLVKEMSVFDAAYRAGSPLISDSVWDKQIQRLITYEKRFPERVLLNSPTRRVSTEKGSVVYDKPMLSIDNVFDMESLKKWIKKFGSGVGFVVEPKVDGVACRYDPRAKNKLTTRGGGKDGKPISDALLPLFEDGKYIEQAPVDGELWMTDKHAWAMGYANGRAAVIGIVASKVPDPASLRYLRFFPYTYHGQTKTYHNVRENTSIPIHDTSEIEGALSNIDLVVEVNEIPVDGYVIKLTDLELREKTGTSSRAYKWAIAYKPDSVSCEATVKDIEWSISEYGNVTGRLQVEPTALGNITVSSVKIHNPNYFKVLKLHRGDRVEIKHAGKVIPDIVNNLGGGTTAFEAPTKCPSCGSSLEYTYTISGPVWRCTKPKQCPAVRIARLVSTFSKDKIHIKDGLSRKRLTDLYEAGLIRLPGDLWDLTEGKLKEVGLLTPWYVDLLEKLKEPLWFPVSTGLLVCAKEGIGPFKANRDATGHEDLPSVLSVKSCRAYDIEWGLSLVGRVDFGSPKKVASLWSDKTFAVTGTLRGFSRRELKDLIEYRGARYSSSVGLRTDYLIVGKEAGSKLEVAKRLGVIIIYEKDFDEIVAGRQPLPGLNPEGFVDYKNMKIYWVNFNIPANQYRRPNNEFASDPRILYWYVSGTDSNSNLVYSARVAARDEEEVQEIISSEVGMEVKLGLSDTCEKSLEAIESFIEKRATGPNVLSTERIKRAVRELEPRREELRASATEAEKIWKDYMRIAM